MKKQWNLVLLTVLFVLLCGASACADGFSDIFVSVHDYDAILDRTTNNCMIQPQASGIDAYAIDDQLLLPCLTKDGDVLTIGFLMKGANSLSHPVNMRIYTDEKVYSFIPSASNSTQTMLPIILNGQSYNMCMLPSYAYHVLSDIAASRSVSVSYSSNSGFTNASTFTLSADMQHTFKAVDSVYQKYFSVGEDGSKMYTGMDFVAEMMMTFSEKNNNAGMWD